MIRKETRIINNKTYELYFDVERQAYQVAEDAMNLFLENTEKLECYEDAEEQGLLLRLPYNIATCGVVYYVDEKDREIYRLQSDKIEIYKMMISNKFVYTIDCYDFFYEDFGKIVFTNKEEAEAALQAMKEDKR